MSVKDKLSDFFRYNDPDDGTEEPEAPKAPISKYEKKGNDNNMSSLPNISIVEPRSFEDAFVIADKLKAGGSVMINLKKLSSPYKQRMIDILQGVTFGLGGKTVKTDDNSILCTPRNISVDNNVVLETTDE